MTDLAIGAAMKAWILCDDCAKQWDVPLTEIPKSMLKDLSTDRCTECRSRLVESPKVWVRPGDDR